MKQTEDITPLEYAALGIKGNTTQNITKHLREGKPLPSVLKVKKFSRFYLLEVPKGFAKAKK